MNPQEYARMHALEDWYWWYVARRTAALRFVKDHAPADRPLRILDAGCGTGALLDQLRSWDQTEAVGLDFSPDALMFSHRRGHPRLAGGRLEALPFRDDQFHVVTSLDVLEHTDSDDLAMEEIRRVLRPGGILVASVPAYQFLWGPHDEALHHRRRYTAEQFRRLVSEAGLVTEKCTYLLSALFPVALIHRLALRRGSVRGNQSADAGVPGVPGWINSLLVGVQRAELEVARQVSLPFGLTVLTVARKPVPITAAAPRLTTEELIPAPATR